jgi:hypothetical protein
MLRRNDDGLSVNWLEFFKSSDRKEQISKIRKVYNKKLNVRKSARIAVLNVGDVCGNVQTKSPDARELEVLHAPSSHDPSHSGIYGLRQNDELIAELILETVLENHPAHQE